MLKESALVPNSDIGKNTGGFHLGPVGGRIVGEVVIGLLQTDPGSHLLHSLPGCRPCRSRGATFG
jgi:hypothetical protein